MKKIIIFILIISLNLIAETVTWDSEYHISPEQEKEIYSKQIQDFNQPKFKKDNTTNLRQNEVLSSETKEEIVEIKKKKNYSICAGPTGHFTDANAVGLTENIRYLINTDLLVYGIGISYSIVSHSAMLYTSYSSQDYVSSSVGTIMPGLLLSVHTSPELSNWFFGLVFLTCQISGSTSTKDTISSVEFNGESTTSISYYGFEVGYKLIYNSINWVFGFSMLNLSTPLNVTYTYNDSTDSYSSNQYISATQSDPIPHFFIGIEF